MLALSHDPSQHAALRADPTLFTGAVEEVLRYDGPVQGLARVTAVDVELSDTKVPAGSRVQLRYGSANRDEREFPDAGTFDVRRAPGRHVAFGHGIHHCLGAALARLEGRIVLEELVRRTQRMGDHRARRTLGVGRGARAVTPRARFFGSLSAR